MANLTDADKVLRNDVGKTIASKLDDIADAIVAQGGGAHSLDQLSDVDIDSQTLAAGQSIVYNDVTEKFENGEVSTVAALDDLTDVSITSAQQGDSLRNDGNGNWVNEPTTIAMTQDDWDDIQDKTAWKNAHKNTNLIITDAPNLNATAQNLSYDGGVDTVWDKVEAKQAQITYTQIIDEAFTTSTSFAYTGKSVTCPVGHIYIVRARISYSNGAPQEIGASNSSTASDIYRCYARTDKACEVVFILTGGESAYIWAKYASASSNMVRITAVDITV